MSRWFKSINIQIDGYCFIDSRFLKQISTNWPHKFPSASINSSWHILRPKSRVEAWHQQPSQGYWSMRCGSVWSPMAQESIQRQKTCSICDMFVYIYVYTNLFSHHLVWLHFILQFSPTSIAGKFSNPIIWSCLKIRPCQLTDHFDHFHKSELPKSSNWHTPLLAAILPRSKSLGSLVSVGEVLIVCWEDKETFNERNGEEFGPTKILGDDLPHSILKSAERWDFFYLKWLPTKNSLKLATYPWRGLITSHPPDEDSRLPWQLLFFVSLRFWSQRTLERGNSCSTCGQTLNDKNKSTSCHVLVVYMILVLVLVNPQKVGESWMFSLRFTPKLRSNRTPISHPWPCCTVLANCWKLFKATSNWRRDLNCWAMNLGGSSVGCHFGNVNGCFQKIPSQVRPKKKT